MHAYNKVQFQLVVWYFRFRRENTACLVFWKLKDCIRTSIWGKNEILAFRDFRTNKCQSKYAIREKTILNIVYLSGRRKFVVTPFPCIFFFVTLRNGTGNDNLCLIRVMMLNRVNRLSSYKTCIPILVLYSEIWEVSPRHNEFVRSSERSLRDGVRCRVCLRNNAIEMSDTLRYGAKEPKVIFQYRYVVLYIIYADGNIPSNISPRVWFVFGQTAFILLFVVNILHKSQCTFMILHILAARYCYCDRVKSIRCTMYRAFFFFSCRSSYSLRLPISSNLYYLAWGIGYEVSRRKSVIEQRN